MTQFIFIFVYIYMYLLFIYIWMSPVRFFVTLWTAAYQASLSFTISWSLLKLMSIESMMPYIHMHIHTFSEKAMATHSSTLAWKIPWTEEPGRLQSMGSLSQTRLSDFTFTFHFHALEEEMATHSSVLAWRIPGTEEPDGLPSVGSHRVGHNWSDLAAAAAAPSP